MLYRVTINLATVIVMAGRIGTLTPDADADLSLLRLADGEWRFEDSHGNVEIGAARLEPVSVVRAGKVYPCTPAVYVGGHGH